MKKIKDIFKDLKEKFQKNKLQKKENKVPKKMKEKQSYEELEKEKLEALAEYVRESLINKIDEEDIMRQLLKKGYPQELILKAFELNIKKEEKMVEEAEYEDEEEVEDDDSEEDMEDVEEVEKKEEKPKKVSKKKETPKEVLPQEKRAPTIQEVLMNLDQRIANLEATLFRMRNA